MLEELTVLHGNQRLDQIGRRLVELDQDPVFVVRWIQPADGHRFQSRHRQLATADCRQAGDEVTGEAHPQPPGLLGPFVELETTGMQLDIAACNRNTTGTAHRVLAAVAEGAELGEKIVLVQFLSDEQFERPGVDLRRDGPALAGKLLLHHGIEINGHASQQNQRHDRQFEQPAQPGASRAGAAFRAGTGGACFSHGGALYAL